MNIVKAITLTEGESIHDRRLMPSVYVPHFDPFIRVDHLLIENGGFPNQPHQGFEVLFYLFSGELHHDDDLGNHVDVSAGGAEVFSTGYSMMHAELSKSKVHAFRIWFDLPMHMKHFEPSYQKVDAEDISVEKNLSVSVRTIVGLNSRLQMQTKANVLDVTMERKSVYKYDVPKDLQGFVYVVVGEIKINGKTIQHAEAAMYKHEKELSIICKEGARFMICFAMPHGEPIEIPKYQAV